MKQGLTKRQTEVLDVIRRCARDGMPPTVRELGRELSIGSPNGVMLHLRALERKGWITRERVKARAIRLVDGMSFPGNVN